MGRKDFIADVQGTSELTIPGISLVARGDDDGEVNVCFVPPSGAPIELSMLAQPDLSSYPSESNFMIFARSNDVPKVISGVLEDMNNFSFGLKVPQIIKDLSERLHGVLATGSREAPFAVNDDSDEQMDDVSGEEEEDDAGWESEDGEFSFNPGPSTSTTSRNPELAKKLDRRIRADLRNAKFAGFSIGILQGMKADSLNSLVSLSIRVAKLGLSEEAIQAWDLEPNNYIVLLIRYSSYYKTFDAVITEPAKSLDIAFRIGVSNKYKPTIVEAIAAFTDVTKDHGRDVREGSDEAAGEQKSDAGFSSMFISSSMNEFINDKFISLLKIRSSVGIGWDGAKLYFNDKQGRLDKQSAELPSVYYEESSQKESTLPDPISADHLTDHQVKQISFPLIAAQFAFRYLTRCTEFCLVCHDKIEEDFEALKPYVCSKPLCLYQYMALGFGPSVEHEILTQPYVVDLLVSFCYASALNQKLREYPTGMSLAVPPVAGHATQAFRSAWNTQVQPVEVPATTPEDNSLEVKFDVNRHELIFEDSQSSPVQKGEWVVVTTNGRTGDHYRVEDVSLFPTVTLSEFAVTRSNTTNQTVPGATVSSAVPATPATTPPPPALVPAKLAIYNQNFDDFDNVAKAETIVMLLELLPSIKEMRTFLITQSRTSEPNLRGWKERVSPAALGMLRWIIASNRSCLVQVDKCPGQDDNDVAMAKVRLDQRVSNISDNWVQFRFAQGSPDKEQRFLNALRAQQASFEGKYPTIFAWHGSPLANWHSIIRAGLDFKETLHGRAYGHGVYHAIDQATSVGYAQHNQATWQGSELKISSAMSLNEIVNCPGQFVSSSPYLVVQHIDWIQCRYLFVQVQGGSDGYGAGGNSNNISRTPDPSIEVEQDPKLLAKSTLHKPIGVPLCAVSVSRAFRIDAKDDTPSIKKRKHASSGSKLAIVEMGVSEGETLSDIEFMFTSDEEIPKTEEKAELVILSSTPSVAKPLTDFVPGSLDQSSLPMLEPPSYATPNATKSLNRALKEVLDIQNKTPLHELGWYIDQELINNIYQWIVELHSFDPKLPLTKDMKAAGLTSVVLEIRFGKDYPFSPPFVRVIRPRFLPFMNGGGGHVTAGGAMCMELLTNSGWSAVSSIESVLLQVRMAIMNTDPKPARLESQGKAQQRDYGTGEAIDAYIRACRTHGWQVPPDFNDFAVTGSSGY